MCKKTEEMFLALVINGSLDSVTICCPPFKVKFGLLWMKRIILAAPWGKHFMDTLRRFSKETYEVMGDKELLFSLLKGV